MTWWWKQVCFFQHRQSLPAPPLTTPPTLDPSPSQQPAAVQLPSYLPTVHAQSSSSHIPLLPFTLRALTSSPPPSSLPTLPPPLPPVPFNSVHFKELYSYPGGHYKGACSLPTLLLLPSYHNPHLQVFPWTSPSLNQMAQSHCWTTVNFNIKWSENAHRQHKFLEVQDFNFWFL